MEVVRQTLDAVQLGEPRTVRNLTLFPLIGGPDREDEEPEYLTLEEALDRKAAKVTEVSEGGSVPELLFLNESDRPVLLVDGAALEGAKQNRILNLTLLVPAKSRTKIPVSCVESGRWARRSAHFTSSDYYLFAELRAAKAAQVSSSMRMAVGSTSDQGAVWREIGAKFLRMGSSSPTAAMHDMYTDQTDTLEELTEGFEAVEGQVGVVVGMGGRVVGLDLFDRGKTLRHYLNHIIRSYGIDSLERRRGPIAVPREKAEKFLGRVRDAGMEQYPAVGLGEDVRLQGKKITGGALVHEGRLVHLTAFRQPADPVAPFRHPDEPSVEQELEGSSAGPAPTSSPRGGSPGGRIGRT